MACAGFGELLDLPHLHQVLASGKSRTVLLSRDSVDSITRKFRLAADASFHASPAEVLAPAGCVQAELGFAKTWATEGSRKKARATQSRDRFRTYDAHQKTKSPQGSRVCAHPCGDRYARERMKLIVHVRGT